MSRLGRLLVRHPWIVYAVLAAMAFPILEMILHGEAALQYAHDVFDDDIPRLFSIAADWRANGPVLWDPHLTSGNATLSQFALPPLAPDVILSFIVAPFTAYALNAAFMAFAAGVSMHLFLRDSLRLSTVACFAGGIIATLAFWHYIYGYAALLLPLVLWSTDRAMADGRRRRDALVAVLVVAFLLASSQIQIVVIDGAVALAWVLVTRSPSRPLGMRVGVLVAVWAMALLLAAPVLATQFVAIPASQRGIWPYYHVFPLATKVHEVVRLYNRTVFGVPIVPGLGGSADIYGTFFLGAIGLPLLILGCVVPRRSARERFLLALFIAIPLLDFLAPLASPLQQHIGVLRSFQFVRVRHLVPIVLAINAGIGVDWLRVPDPIGRLSVRRRTVLLVGLVGAGLALAWQVYLAQGHVRHPSGLPLVQDGWRLALIALVGGLLVLVAVAWVVIGRGRPAGRGPTTLAGGLAVVLLLGLAGERLVYARAERALGEKPAFNLGTWADRVAPTPAQEFIASQPGDGRVLSVGEHPNRVLAAGLDGVDGYETIYPLRYHELFGTLIAPQLTTDPHDFVHWGNRAYASSPQVDMDVADLLGVRWLYVRDQGVGDPTLTARFTDGDVTVYENPGAFPRSFIAHEVQVLPDRAAITKAVGEGTADELRGRVFLAAADLPAGGSALAGGGAVAGPPDPTDAATIESDTIDRIAIRTHSVAPGVLVLADTYSPDWVADVDGAPTPILAVDGALRGVALPSGDHVVTFAYRPVATYLGIMLALVAAIGLAGWLALGRFRRERAAPPLSPWDRAAAPPS